jgi:hypothetical protein
MRKRMWKIRRKMRTRAKTGLGRTRRKNDFAK